MQKLSIYYGMVYKFINRAINKIMSSDSMH